MPQLTVFTPTYNRAHTLSRTYESLKSQTCKDFIWLIIDDGSSDNTAELVKQWQALGNGFEIRYIFKENGGMHTAHNTAYENITTELNVCIDSDDAMPQNAVMLILDHWKKVKDKGYVGIIGLDRDISGRLIGSGFPNGMTATTLSGYYSSGGSGDKKLIYRTDIIKKYPPYPVFEGEKYVALAYKYRLIDRDCKLSVLNEVLCDVDYQDNGSTATMYSQYIKNPKGFAFWRKICMQYPESRKRLFIDCIHYVAESLLAENPSFIKESPKKLLTTIALPFGILFLFFIKSKAGKQI